MIVKSPEVTAHPTRLSSRRSLTPFLSRVDMRRVRKGKDIKVRIGYKYLRIYYIRYFKVYSKVFILR